MVSSSVMIPPLKAHTNRLRAYSVSDIWFDSLLCLINNHEESYRSQMLPVMVLACKADLDRAIKPFDASAMLEQYDAGLIEVSNVLEIGREKMKQSFIYMLKAILRQRGSLSFLIFPLAPSLNSFVRTV